VEKNKGELKQPSPAVANRKEKRTSLLEKKETKKKKPFKTGSESNQTKEG